MRPAPLINVGATLAFSTMFALVKLVRAELDPFAVMFWRCSLSLLIAALIGGWRPRVVNRPLVALRVALGFGAMTCFFTAAQALPLTDISLLSRLQPLVVAVGAPLLLGASERVSGRIWVALPMGLLGCGLIIGPAWGSSMGSAGALALLGCLFSGGAHITLRKLGPTEDPWAVVLWFHLCVTLVAPFLSWGTTGALPMAPPLRLLLPLLMIGATALAGQVLMTKAYAMDRATLVVAASYTGPLFSVGFDVLMFDGPPAPHVIAGGLLVITTSLLAVFYRDKPR